MRHLRKNMRLPFTKCGFIMVLLLMAWLLAGCGEQPPASMPTPEEPTPTPISALMSGDLVSIQGMCYSKELQSFDLNHKVLEVSDIETLKYMTNLTRLNLDGVRVKDFPAVKEEMKMLGYSDSELMELMQDERAARTLSISLRDISALAELTTLTWLDLSNNRIDDFSPLAGLTNLTELNLSNNDNGDVRALSGLTHLKKLYLTENPVSDEQIEALQAALPDCEIFTDANYRHSIIWNQKLLEASDIEALKRMTKLTHLSLSGVGIKDFDVYKERMKDSGQSDEKLLEYMQEENPSWAVSVPLRDISALAGLTTLSWLDLSNNRIDDFSPLAGLTNLTDLNLSHNDSGDVSALFGLTHLTTLNVRKNPISDEQIEALRAALPNCEIIADATE